MKALCLLLALAACAADPPSERYDYGLPASIDAPPAPPDNLTTRAKVELGRALFFERKLSSDQTFSCASCHQPERAFTDGLAVARGLRGEDLPRNTMSLANVAYFDALTWANPKLHTLEGQALVPLLSTSPRELGVATQMDEVCERLRADHAPAFREAFPGDGAITPAHVIAALASFERTLLSFHAPYDAFLAGDASALNASATRGKALFESERLRCVECHAGRLQTDAALPAHDDAPFHNIGLYNIAGRNVYPHHSPGLYEFTERARDMGRFRTPSLRNVARTAPYMHDGSIATLDGVLDHYAAGGRTIAAGPYAGNGALNAHKDPRIAGFSLSAEERRDVLAFLESLSDPQFGR